MAARVAGTGPPGAAPAAPGLEARGPLAGGRRVADVVATVTVLVAATAAALAVGWGIVFLSLGFHSCGAPGNRCDETLGGVVVWAGPVVVALVVVLTIVLSVLRMVRRRVAWPVALIGLVAVVAVFFAALLLVDSAVTLGI